MCITAAVANLQQVIRVFNDNAGTTSKTLPITLPCTIESLADQMRKKMRGEDTSEYWIHEVKETKGALCNEWLAPISLVLSSLSFSLLARS